MKTRMFSILLVLLLLCGCGAPQAPAKTPTAPPVSVTEVPTEAAEKGAITEPLTAYPLEENTASALAMFGDDLLLFYSYDQTVLTRFDTDAMMPVATMKLDCSIYPGDATVQISEKGITYLDEFTRELVFLDQNLKEVKRFPVPENALEMPALSQDRRILYYMTSTGLRALDLESGIDRLVREMSYSYQSITDLHCGSTIIRCGVSDHNGTWRYLFLDCETGRILFEQSDYITLYTAPDRYFAITMDGSYEERLTGIPGEQVRMLNCHTPNASCHPILEQDAVVVVTDLSDTRSVLDYYRLSDGMHPSSLPLPEGVYPWTVTGSADSGCIWFLSYDPNLGCDVLYRWNPELSPTEDDTVYIGLRRTAENPDLYGLEKCAELAEEISERHNVKVLTWLDATAVEPWDYTFEPEYQVPLIEEALHTIDSALSAFPDGFLRKATAEMGDGTLRVSLARGLYGVADSGALDSASGVQFWDDQGNSHICLQIGYGLEQNLFHELYHVIESRIYSHSQRLDNWDDLNPRGFSYDYEYRSYMKHDEYHWLEDDNRAFIDFYSMTYPKEDRARILEYATAPDNAYYFTSPTMQQKLRTLCLAIREAYDLETVTDAFLWEQYLDSPIHANG